MIGHRVKGLQFLLHRLHGAGYSVIFAKHLGRNETRRQKAQTHDTLRGMEKVPDEFYLLEVYLSISQVGLPGHELLILIPVCLPHPLSKFDPTTGSRMTFTLKCKEYPMKPCQFPLLRSLSLCSETPI